jgi:hypothetical protein
VITEASSCALNKYQNAISILVLFFQVKRWKKKVEEECGTIPMVLVQNKMDLLYNSAVDR